MKIIKQRCVRQIEEHSIEFRDAEGAGFAFDADKSGNVILHNDCQRENYEYALAHPELYQVYAEHTVRRYSITEPAVGVCICGEEVTLEDRYLGACQCGNCGQWYNTYGTALIPPEYWGD